MKQQDNRLILTHDNLDTNIISEIIRPKPEPVVVAWIEQQPSSLLYTTTVLHYRRQAKQAEPGSVMLIAIMENTDDS